MTGVKLAGSHLCIQPALAHVVGFGCGLCSAVKFILCLLPACAGEQKEAVRVCVFGGKELNQGAEGFWGVGSWVQKLLSAYP